MKHKSYYYTIFYYQFEFHNNFSWDITIFFMIDT